MANNINPNMNSTVNIQSKYSKIPMFIYGMIKLTNDIININKILYKLLFILMKNKDIVSVKSTHKKIIISKSGRNVSIILHNFRYSNKKLRQRNIIKYKVFTKILFISSKINKCYNRTYTN